MARDGGDRLAKGGMPTERLSMRQTKEILRQKWQCGLSHRDVAASVGVSAGAVAETLRRAKQAGLATYVDIEGMAPSGLEERLYPSVVKEAARITPDCAWVHRERRRPGVTLELLHHEYLEKQPGGYGYTQFCHLYRQWAKKRGASMRQVHIAGEKTFVDYSGKRPSIWDPKTGEKIAVELFVAVLGASSYTFAEATETQKSRDWIGSHTRAVAYFGGTTTAFVCDQLRSGVTTPCAYEPGVQRTYEDWAEHHDAVILPARARRPKDKAKAEVAVQVAQRWILARIRNERHFSLDSLNIRIAELLEELNGRTMRVYRASRREMFERLDKPALRDLPPKVFVYGKWKHAKVNVDYHVEIDGHYYSVPHQHVGEGVEVRFTASTVEVLIDGRRIASHTRSYKRGQHTTVDEHMPAAHRKHKEWSPSRLINWAGTIGTQTKALVEAILLERRHPEMGYRSCLGILRLSKRYGETRLEAACARAVQVRARSYRHVDSILKNGLDGHPLTTDTKSQKETPLQHENIRGPHYYN